MVDNIKVSEADIKEFADGIGAPHVLISALTDHGIDEAIDLLIDRIEFTKNVVAGSVISGKQLKKKVNKDKPGCSC